VFAKRGLNGTTTRHLAKAAGVTEGTIFKHFPSKAALYAEVVREAHKAFWSDEWIAGLEEKLAAGDQVGFVHLLFAQAIDQCERHPEHARLILYSGLESESAVRAISGAVPRFPQLLERFIEQGRRTGRIAGGSTGLLIRLLLAVPTYHVLHDQFFRSPHQRCETSELLEAGVQFVMAGLRGIGAEDGALPALAREYALQS
jgi:AcrR family transcriptional regulator